jgi:RNA polymerase sigma factor (sigma-70 family)
MNANNSFTDKQILYMLKSSTQEMEQAIHYLYKNYQEFLGNFILSHGGNSQDADDLFQETIVSFIDMVKLNKFREEASIKTMLYTINKNLWYTEITKRGKTHKRELLYNTDNKEEEATIADYISGRESRVEILKIIEALGDSCKNILLLYYYENLSMKEILERTEYENEQVVRNKKYKCLKQLEQMITKDPLIYTKLLNALEYVK